MGCRTSNSNRQMLKETTNPNPAKTAINDKMVIGLVIVKNKVDTKSLKRFACKARLCACGGFDKNVLIKIGFTMREAEAYLVLLSFEEALASEISDKNKGKFNYKAPKRFSNRW
jgi:hypothetical protein